jgi:hypothetical protein
MQYLTYNCTPLLQGEIRLMILLSGEVGEPIRCKLEPTTPPEDTTAQGSKLLGPVLPYETLSYM